MVQQIEEDPTKWDFLPVLNNIYKTKSPPNKMKTVVPNMPWLKYNNIMKELDSLEKEIKDNGPPPAPGMLETVMVNWLKDVAPEKVIPKWVKAIHEFACAIGDKVGEVRGDDAACPIAFPCVSKPSETPNPPKEAAKEVVDSICNCLP